MNKSGKTLIFYILAFVSLAVLAASGYTIWRQFTQVSEVLIVWGVRDGECIIQIIDPDRQEVLSTTKGEVDCSYQVVQSVEADWFIHIQRAPAKITHFSISSRGHISVENEISASDMKLTSQPQLAPNGMFYVSGVVDGREQIYRFDMTSGRREQITDKNAMAFDPVVSPDGTYVAYLFDEKGLFRDPYYEGSSSQYYYVQNLRTGEETALAPFADLPDYPNCQLRWSPTGNVVAFAVGCNHNATPQQLIVVDVDNNTLLGKIDPISSDEPRLSMSGWVNDTSLVYCASADHPPDTQPHYIYDRCFTYDTSNQEATEIKLLSLLGMPFAPYYLEGVDWTDGGRRLAARITDATRPDTVVSSTLVTMTMDDGFTQLNLLDLGETSTQSEIVYREPKWAPSGSWIAYYNGVEVGLVDGSGTEAYEIISLEGVPRLECAWLRLNTRPFIPRLVVQTFD